MRKRLVIVFMAPLLVVMAVLGGGFAWNNARSVQQAFENQQLEDTGHFVTSARQALRADSRDAVASEAERYGELYGSWVLVTDRTGEYWAHGGEMPVELDPATEEQLSFALTGRRAEAAAMVWPWSTGDAIMIEPVPDDGNVIGAVVVASSIDSTRAAIMRNWTLLAVIALLTVALSSFIAIRLANWVLRPVLRVDSAMAAIERGDVAARIDDDTGPPETRRMIREFNRMAEEIEQVISKQQEFVLNASHELRNPLGALLLRLEYLATGLDSTWDDDVEEAREEGRRMTRIVDTLLGMARSNQRDSTFAAVDLCELVTERMEAWRSVADRKDIGFVWCGGPAALVVTDRTAVESALDAVIDNAMKYSPSDAEVEVGVSAASGEATIVVRDHGPGLGPDELERATDRFWRSARSQGVSGSGLGLSIAADLMASLNGELHLEVPTGGGLRVSLRLPEGARE